MYCGLKVIKDAVNPVLKTTAFFSNGHDLNFVQSTMIVKSTNCRLRFIFKTSLVGGSVIKITYKKVQQMKEQL